MSERDARRGLRRSWPWGALGLAVLPAIWYVVDYESDVDPEFPAVQRPTFNAYPPPAYRFAEPGDTIDHAAVYVASAALVLCAWGILRGPGRRAWAAALALSLAGFWHAATPGPLLDGWHGVGWRAMADPAVPASTRLTLAGFALALATLFAWGAAGVSWPRAWAWAREQRIAGLTIVAGLLMVLRQLPWVDHEPLGFWPRWIYVWGLLAWAFAVVRVAPPVPSGWRRGAALAGLLLAWLVLDVAGRGVFWYQRPLRRLREMVPGRIYLSAMPTYSGLELAQARHHFKTIINLFPEYTPERSPLLPDELRFAREHGIEYIANEQTDDVVGTAFIARTLEAAKDPARWPILVHCHASMDRSPAWVGIYRFVVQGWPLADVLREIECHRGLRPKASVTLLYNRVLPLLAPEQSAQDPTTAVLRRCAEGTIDPVAQLAARRRAGAAERR